VSNKLPVALRARTRNMGLILAMMARIGLLLAITWVISFERPLFSVFDTAFSGRDLILGSGGLFLIANSTREISQEMEGEDEDEPDAARNVSVSGIILQIIMLDIIFSFDSSLTAIGLTKHIEIMIVAVVLSSVIMIAF